MLADGGSGRNHRRCGAFRRGGVDWKGSNTSEVGALGNDGSFEFPGHVEEENGRTQNLPHPQV